MDSVAVEKMASSADKPGKRSESLGLSNRDSEKGVGHGETEVLKRSLKNRHIQMIAIGGQQRR
jgi:amino acid permease